jgi:hypothetical protein
MAPSFQDPGPVTFRSRIVRNGDVANSSAFVEFPHDLKELFGVGNLVPVKATFDGRIPYQGVLAKMGGPHPVLVMRKDVREQLGKGPGDEVEVEIRLDDAPRTVVLADDVAAALDGSGARTAFDGLAYSHRKEFVRWIEEAKRPETRQRRIDSTCEMVNAGQTRAR